MFDRTLTTALAACAALCGVSPAQHHRVDNDALLGVVTTEEKAGVTVAHVLGQSPAAAAKLQPGDVLLEVGGERIVAVTDVDRALRPAKPGEEVKVVYRRKGKKRTVAATVVDRKQYAGEFLSEPPRGSTGIPAPKWWGFAWSNTSRARPAPTPENTRGKVVVFHAFQSW